MKYEFLLLDLDDTILDFHKAEYIALGKTLESFGLDPTEQVRARYSQINKAHWERLERKELTREQVLVGRFGALFAEYGITVDDEADGGLIALRQAVCQPPQVLDAPLGGGVREVGVAVRFQGDPLHLHEALPVPGLPVEVEPGVSVLLLPF